MYLVEIKYNRFVVYTYNGKLVIQTSDRRIAKGFLDGKDNSKRNRPAEDIT
jgi:hypothetical protein